MKFNRPTNTAITIMALVVVASAGVVVRLLDAEAL
jgi:hypothetical protein